jgi:hypothetical protein
MGMIGARSHTQQFSASAVPVIYREQVTILAGGFLFSEIVTSSGLPYFNLWVSSDLGVQVTAQFALGNQNQATAAPNWQSVGLPYLVPAANVPNVSVFKAVASRYRARFDNLGNAPVTISYWLSSSIS